MNCFTVRPRTIDQPNTVGWERTEADTASEDLPARGQWMAAELFAISGEVPITQVGIAGAAVEFDTGSSRF